MGDPLIVAEAGHNLGCVRQFRGDIPGALRDFDLAERRYRELKADGALPILAVDRARALLAAGLYGEADRQLERAASQFRRDRLTQDLAECLLVRAEAAILAGRPVDARTWADAARAAFRRRGNAGGAAIAALASARARLAGGAAEPALAGRADALAGVLRASGLLEAARSAETLAVRVRLASGRRARCPPSARPVRADRLDTRLQWRLARAEEAHADGRRRDEARQLRAGLAELNRHRSRLGCLDLQTAASVHGQELARSGLALAMSRSSPLATFEWSERVRAQALLLPAPRPPEDAEAAAALEQLRHARSAVADAEMRGLPTGAPRRECARLERVVRERAWFAAGGGVSAPLAAFDEVCAELAGAALVSYVRYGSELAALTVVDGIATLTRIGPYAPVAAAVRRLVADVDALAVRLLSAALRDTVTAATRRDAEAVAGLLLEPLPPSLGDRPLVVVPSGVLSTVPWAAVAAGRPVTVTPSASAWLGARRRAADRSGVLMVAGPDLAHAEPEIRGIAALRPDAHLLTGPAATAAGALSAVDGMDTVHVAAHGRHEPENPMFSGLQLSDGPLMAYDLQRVPRPPRLVLLSACDLGMQEVRHGDEPLGLPAALLAAGSCTIVGSVCRVADEHSVGIMTTVHRRLADGCEPAVALAAATAEHLVGLIAYGAG